MRPGYPCFSIPDRLDNSFRPARQHRGGQADQDAEADDHAEAGRAEAAPGGAGIEQGRRHQPAGTPGLYRLMPTPGYRLSDRTGISDLVISADSDECFTPEGFVCAPELKIVVQVHAVQIGGCFAQWSPWWR